MASEFLKRLRLASFARDARGIAAIEFALIVPVMLMIFFGAIQVSTGFAVERKVTMVTRTVSDLISQASQISDIDIANAFVMAGAVMTPYPATPIQAIVSQIYIDANKVAKVKWSRASNATARGCNDVITLPTGLQVPNTYLIMSEVTYNFRPVVGHDSALNYISPVFPLHDRTFTRPRQSLSVQYPTAPACT
ncbi:MAG: pilus assembly protein [Rhizobiales bacterium]|nr:pilus assembly protein [Hyphomicrobiales bacterium]